MGFCAWGLQEISCPEGFQPPSLTDGGNEPIQSGPEPTVGFLDYRSAKLPKNSPVADTSHWYDLAPISPSKNA
jgi:hypothetical protein